MRLSVPVLLLAGAAGADPQFRAVEVPPHVYSGGWEHYVGGGVAVFDCNGDHLPEMFAAGGEMPATLFVNESAAAVAFRADTPEALAITGVTGAYPLDLDGDGLGDLAVLRAGRNLLLRGLGNCEFTPYEPEGFDGGDRWTTAFSATWEGDAALPTLVFGNYVNRDDPDGPFEACDAHQLFRPVGDGYAAQVLEPGYCTLSMLFTDWDRRGRADLRVSNDRHYYVRDGAEQMWAMAPAPRLLTETDGWRTHRLWGMGIASRDLDGDGLAEVMLTSMGDQRLQRRDGEGPAYEDVDYALGTTAHRPYAGGDGRPSTGWHAQFGDVQNDGRDDLLIVKGNVEQMPDAAMRDPNNLLVQGADGRFSETGAAAGIASLHRGRGGALVDLNADGLLDIVAVNRRAPLEVWQNMTPDAGNWLSVRPEQNGPNSRAVGAYLELRNGDRLMTREITIGGGHAGGQDVPEHFGLGAARSAQLRVIWPDGAASDWVELAAGHRYRISRDGVARY